jgi:protease-4
MTLKINSQRGFRMGYLLVRFFAFIGFLSLVMVIATGALIWTLLNKAGQSASVTGPIVLHLDLRQKVLDTVEDNFLLSAFSDSGPVLHSIIDALDRGSVDPRVVALVADFGGDSFSLATAQEIRDAITRFRSTGRLTIAYSDSFGEFSPGNTAYYLAASCEQVWLGPIGNVSITGIRSEVPFARNALDMLGVTAQFVRHGLFKSFTEMFTEDGFSPEHRSMVEELDRSYSSL